MNELAMIKKVKLTFLGVFAKLDRDCSKIVVVNVTRTVAIEKFKNDAIGLKIVVTGHRAGIHGVSRLAWMAHE